MNRKLSAIVILILVSGICFSQNKSSLLTRMIVLQTSKHTHDSNGNKKQNFVLPQKLTEKYTIRKAGEKYFIGAFIEVDISKISEQNLLLSGIKINTKIGNIWSVEIPIETLAEIESLQGIKYVDAGGKVKQCLDNARIETRTNQVNNGYQLPLPYNGQGVIVGIVDAGFDFTHPMFKDATGNNLRVSRAWIHNDNSGTVPNTFSYGSEYVGQSQITGKVTDDIYNSHGTHVAGIAAGSGFGSNNLYRGVASEAEIVQVALDFSNGNPNRLVDAFSYICKYAESVNKPAIVNMSLALDAGLYNGTSLFEKSLDSLINDKHILVVSAGNFAAYNMHVEKNSTPVTDTLKSIFLTRGPVPVGIWSDQNAVLTYYLCIYDLNGQKLLQTPFYNSLSNSIVNTAFPLGVNNDSISLTIVTQAVSDLNSKAGIMIETGSKSGDDYYCSFSVTSSIGNIHAWNLWGDNFYNSINGIVIQGAKNGDNNYTIFAPGTVKNAITVGAYTTKKTFTYLSGLPGTITTNVDSGAIATFSSKGPCLGGYMKPQITAPGNTIVSGVNSSDSYYSNINESVFSYNNWYYAPMAGTSMASPMVAGIIALMYQANPMLTRNQTEAILLQSARQDSHTGIIPASGNSQWGWGKIDAHNAVSLAIELGVNENKKLLENVFVYPNPANDKIFIATNNNFSKEITVSLFNITGTQIITDKFIGHNQQIAMDISMLTTGIYIIKIKDEHTNQYVKLIKQ